MEAQVSKAKGKKGGNVRNAGILDTEVRMSVWVDVLIAYYAYVG